MVSDKQDYIASGQFGGGERLLDVSDVRRDGTVLVYMEPLYPGGFKDIVPGSQCMANLYSNHHDEIADPNTSFGRGLVLQQRRCAGSGPCHADAHSGGADALPHAGLFRRPLKRARCVLCTPCWPGELQGGQGRDDAPLPVLGGLHTGNEPAPVILACRGWRRPRPTRPVRT